MNQSVATTSSRPTFHADIFGLLETVSPEFMIVRCRALTFCGVRVTCVDPFAM